MEWVFGGAAAAGAAASARWAWWRKSVEGLSVLMYHKVGAPPEPTQLRKLWVSTEAFESQIVFLKRNGYTPVRFSDLERSARTGTPLPEKPVLITFDDGYRNNFLEAFPVLQRHGVPAGVFVVYETIGRHNAWHDPGSEPWVDMLRKEDMREMADSGLIEFGSHTMRHRNLGQAPLDEARWELEESKARLEELLGHEVPFFAYPYGGGAEDPAVREAALKAGYRFDFGIRQAKAVWPWKPEQGALPRLFIRWEDTALDFRLKMTRERARLFGDHL